MPVLQPEPDMFPENLLAMGSSGSGEESLIAAGEWHCLHTKPRQEKASARHLYKNELSYYLPLGVQESQTPKGRKFTSHMPLFTSYVFGRFSQEDRIKVLKGNHLVNILNVPDQTKLVRDLQQIHQMLHSGFKVQSAPCHPVGAVVRITNGPLMGLVGVVDRRGPRDRFVAIVHFLGQGASVELLDWQVEVVATS